MNGFRAMRIRAKIKQIDAAERLGVNQSTVSMWESGENKPRADILLDIAKAYDCTVDDLLRDDSA